MKKLLQVEDYIENTGNYFIVDVRSPGEFAEMSIPGAVNVPLFTDEERAIVGTTYWREGTDRAKLVGLAFAAQKMAAMVEAILEGAAGREMVLYCWRGGLRSSSVAALLEILGYPVYMLVGGYKGFRRQVVRFLKSASIDLPVFVLNGLTGVGKTLIIKELQAMGAPALDLEAMANHRGSVFGSVGLGMTHSQKDFEALLFMALKHYKEASYLIVEGEGRRIGPVIIPDFFSQAMSQGPHLLLETSLDMRVERIMQEYDVNAFDHKDALAESVLSLEKRLGREKCIALSSRIASGHFEETVRLLCTDYYDRYYRDSRQKKGDYLDIVDVTDLKEGASKVQAVIDTYMKGGTELDGGIHGAGRDL